MFFDCDDCLYFNKWETARLLTEKIEEYCLRHLGLPPGKAYELYKAHGTCLRGLIEEDILESSEVDAFLEAVHDIPLHDIKPDPGERKAKVSDRWTLQASLDSGLTMGGGDGAPFLCAQETPFVASV